MRIIASSAFPMPAKHILIIDDDFELAELLKSFMESEGFAVQHAPEPVAGLSKALSGMIDLIILDIMLPGQSGLEVLKQIRAESIVPILMLTAKGDDTDRILGLELGADDYVPKPATAREILARVKAILRRTDSHGGHGVSGQVAVLRVGALSIDAAARVATLHGQALALTSTEFNFLELLAKHAGNIVSKAQLSEVVLGRPLQRYDRSVDVHISRVRDKLAVLNAGNNLIQTVYRQGYQLIKEAS